MPDSIGDCKALTRVTLFTQYTGKDKLTIVKKMKKKVPDCHFFRASGPSWVDIGDYGWQYEDDDCGGGFFW